MSLLSASFSASAKFASALLRVMSAILVLSVIRPERADCEVVSSDLHVFSLVVANVSKARFACSMLIFMRSRNDSGISGFMNASLAMVLSCCRTCPSSVCDCDGGLEPSVLWRMSQVLYGHHAAPQ